MLQELIRQMALRGYAYKSYLGEDTGRWYAGWWYKTSSGGFRAAAHSVAGTEYAAALEASQKLGNGR